MTSPISLGEVICYYQTMQYLPSYRHDFETDTRFITTESHHYIFHYFKDSEAERDIQIIINTQEQGFEKIINFLCVTAPERKINYYFYPDELTKTALMGDDWYAQSIYDEFRVHVLYTETIKPIGPHEDVHLLSLPWGLSIGFFQEGLAEYMVGHAWDGELHTTYVMEGYKKSLYPSLSEFMRHETWLETDDTKAIYFYSLAGSFIAFLIKNYGRDNFENLYRKTAREHSKEVNATKFETIYGKNIADVEIDYKNSVMKLMNAIQETTEAKEGR